MTGNSTLEERTARARLSRRGYLATASGLGVSLVGGSVDHSRSPAAQPGEPASPARTSSERRSDFLWLGAGLWRDEAVRENLFAFARRHDLAVVLVKSRSSEAASDENVLDRTLRPPLAAASEFDLDVWLNVGLLNDLPVDAFVADGDAREGHLAWLRSVARLHGDLFDGGRVILWQEAPVMGQWVEGGEWNEAAVDNLLEFGPEIFAAQRRAVEAANDALDVGVFVHFPYIVDSKRPEVFADLARRFRQRDAEPDFGFVDFYRGWYEKDVGPEPADAAVRSLLSNARSALDGRPVFYLGQSHTINPNHTPSKQAMRMNLRSSIDAGAAGLGWYVRNRYVPTEVGFDPFVPNVAGADLDGDSINTLTVARDRFLYPWLATLESGDGFDPDEAFDLWLVGDGFDFYDHRLWARAADGAWEYVGDFGGTADGEYPDGSAVTDRATVFRALDRDRFLGGETLECRIETSEESDGAELQSALAMPCDPDAYVSEREAVALVRGEAPVEEYSLGATGDRIALAPGETKRVTVPVTGATQESLARLRHPEDVDLLRRVASFEERESVDPSARFELWAGGTDLAGPSALPSIVDRDGTARSPSDVGVVASTDDVAVCYGLERERFLGADGLELARDAGQSVDACYAMPYAGSAPFRPPARAAELLAEQPGEVETFSLDYTLLE